VDTVSIASGLAGVLLTTNHPVESYALLRAGQPPASDLRSARNAAVMEL